MSSLSFKYLKIRLIYLKNLIYKFFFGDVLEIELKKEVKNIKQAFKNDVKEFVIVYDNLISATSYGEYLYVLMLAKYFLAQKYKIKFYIIESDLTRNINDLTESKRSAFLDDQIFLAKRILNFNKEILFISKITWGKFANLKFNNSHIIFSEFIYKQERIYSKCFNLLNKLLSHESKAIIDKVLFNKSDFLNDLKTPPKPYILFACRYSFPFDGSQSRNIDEKEFIYFYNKLSNSFPNHNILVLSDEFGCDHFAKIAIINNLKCLFSNSYINKFIDNLQLILEGDFYFQYKGGGITTFALFSDIPYECIMKPIHEKMFNKNKFCSWQNKNQKFINDISLPIY